MTLRTGNSRIRDNRSRGTRAFTLVELILVMTLLLIVFGVALPSLKGFFRGQDLSSEARRFLALTRYGQSRAVSESVPMVLWIDPKGGTYGLQTQAGYTDADSNAVRFVVAKDLRMEVQLPVVTTASSMASQLNQAVTGVGNMPRIRFTPDGFIGENSPEMVLFRQGANDAIGIVESTNRLKYEIQDNISAATRR